MTYKVPARSLLDLPEEHDLQSIALALEAGSQGDAAASQVHDLNRTFVHESPARFILQDLIDHGDDAPAWAYSRWCVDLAYRSMLMAEDPRPETAVRHVMAALYPDAVGRALKDDDLLFLGTMLAAGDVLVADLALFEMGGLEDYLAEQAKPGLLARTDRIHDWTSARMGAFEVVGLRGCRLVLRSLADGGTVEVLHLAAGCPPGATVVGRPVPITDEPGLMFARAPVEVDPETAREVADAVRSDVPLGWLFGLSTALEAGRAEEGFHQASATMYTSDLPLEVPLPGIPTSGSAHDAPRITELRARGYSELVANAVAVLELGLMAAQVSDQAAAVVAPHVMAALSTPGAFEAAKVECIAPEHADDWRVLSAVAPEHVARKLRELAALCDTDVA